MDRVSRERRSANMAAIRGKNTVPELAVRSVLRQLGVGYRVHDKSLKGRPDVVMKGRRKVIFVHGCFWHRHQGCRLCYEPKSRAAFWAEKFAKNIQRDARNMADLHDRGWDILIIWECQTLDAIVLKNRVAHFLGLTTDE
jgi:DNA mismatch endonuclease, patch repair protein